MSYERAAKNLPQLGPLLGPECFNFDVSIDFNNDDYDGQMPVELKVDPHRMQCPQPRIVSSDSAALMSAHNYTVIILSVLSLILCVRALVRAQFLKYRTKRLFKTRFGLTLTTKEKLLFLNGWYEHILVGDRLRDPIKSSDA